MNEHNNERQFIARTQLYHDINKLPRRFLRRNLDHIFDSHDALREGNVNAIEGAADEVTRRARWQPPTDAMMAKYIEASTPRFTLDSFLLRPHGTRSRNRDSINLDPIQQSEDGPDWLPHPDRAPRPCQVSVYIHCKQTAQTKVYHEIRNAQIYRFGSSDGRPIFDVRLHRPFVIEADQLKVNKEMLRDDASRYGERKMTDRYSLEIGISCSNSSDAAKLLAEIQGTRASDYADAPLKELAFRAVWGDPNTNTTTSDPGLPVLPPRDSLLRLVRAHGHKSSTLKYGLQPNMSWNTDTNESILTTYNRQLRRLRSARQMPTPSPSEDAEPLSRPSVRYQFRKGDYIHRSVHMTELKCIFCPNEREHSSIGRLYGHYATHHEHFSIQIEEHDEDSNVRIIWMQLKEEPREVSKELLNFSWQATGDAFDATEYLHAHSRGERTGWETEEHDTKQKPFQAQQKPYQTKGRRGRPLAYAPQVLELVKKKTTDMPPDQVPDLPALPRRKHAVPRVKGVDFYRTTSKQVLCPGDLISDSDEETDDSWLYQRLRHEIYRSGRDDVCYELHEMLNKHLDDERPQSDILVRDAMVRFTRKHKHRLKRPKMRPAFCKQLERLSRAQVISKNDLSYCLNLLADAAAADDVAMGGMDEDEPASTDLARLRRSHEPSQGHSTSSGARDQGSRSLKATVMAPTSNAPVTNQQHPLHTRSIPFGRCKFVCRRTKGSKQKPYHGDIEELLKDDMTHIKPDEIQPRHLDWSKFIRILDNDFIYIRTSDNIVCISSRLVPLVTDEEDWYAALDQAAKQQFGDGTLVFELHTTDSYQQLLESLPESQGETRPGTATRDQDIRNGLRPVPRKQPCECGQIATGMRGIVGCANVMCQRSFHMACIGLQKRPIDWKCAACSA
ncbi:hypothetical protein CB0940_03137 [Cercospora beticola]|uniref:Zinc finger PHD-type domain-containing protein n=1 Tax=Cercospora beticola TaxID=122368 RepID=A0A2G5I6V7_CERBT|nr:hypothetical protein CB0940_03137 [Cercospora beticola]PIB00213.1 hypothetical protein CB0940_03137 [Cercospora beticola]CAK1361493.1 unnamed protein product [Cercospora beticola]